MATPEQLDSIDRAILDLLRDNARQTSTAIAKHVNLTPGAVRRRIARLEEIEVIDHYTVVLDHDKVGPSIEAYVELTFEGGADVHRLLLEAVKRREIREASTIAGDPDAVVRVRVDNLDHLRETVTGLREMGQVTGSKTLVALGRLRHRADQNG